VFFTRRKSQLFSVGEAVRVKSKDAILKSTDPDRTLDGCLFAPQMWDYCETVHTVSRVVDSLFNERRKRTVRPRAPLYILDQLTCLGRADNLVLACDHACFFLWHEDWLEKIA
jgi:hypothetical protein